MKWNELKDYEKMEFIQHTIILFVTIFVGLILFGTILLRFK